jgi:hypothetical protein
MVTASLSRPRPPGRLFLAAGLGIAGLGVLGYVVQLWLGRLRAPWYLPISGALAVLLVVLALWQARTVWRFLGLGLLGLLAAVEVGVLVKARLPDYTGPVKVDEPFPAFEVARADGTRFTQRDLVGDKNSLLVFFRGRW